MLATETQTEPRSRRHQTFDTKRLEVLGVAARVFSAVGYDRASMRRIAAEAGVSLAGIYHYVASKEALLETIQLHTFDSLLHGLEAELAGRVDPRRRLVAAVRNHLHHVRDHVHELRVCARELETLESTAGGAVHERRRAYIEAVHGLVAAVQGDAETGEHAT
ncbi:MAG: TetR/AcrR family transcriptional regulator, partial [Candidatus Eiseniibacteriota bacterium]